MVVDPNTSGRLVNTRHLRVKSMQNVSAEPALGTILLVDDDVGALDSMSECLNIYGYATLQAQNGQIALDLLKKMTVVPLLILLDMSMPVLDGSGFLERRIKDPVLLDIPVVIVSGSDAAVPRQHKLDRLE